MPLMRTALLTALMLPAVLLAQTSGPFDAIDKHADAAPEQAEASIAALAAYLTAPADTDREKTRAIFRWVTSNIEYDWEGYRTSNYSDTRPKAVLRTRRAVCDGYAGLVEQIGKEAGLEIKKISGYAKGYAYSPGQSFTGGRPNHAWNVVKLDGSWHVMDPTWGSGYINSEEGVFVRRFEEHYFLTPPEMFIFDHYPLEEKWQLLDEPISTKDYEELAYIRPAAFAMGLRAESHTNGMVVTDGDLVMTFWGPDTLAMRAQLSEDGYGDRERTWAFIQREGNEYRVRVHFPYDGYFFIRLFVRTESDTKTLRWAAEYVIECTEDRKDMKQFPEQYPTYFDLNCRLETPLRGLLTAGTTEAFSIRAPGAEAMAIVADSAWTHLTKTNDVFTGDVSFIGPGNAFLYARLPGENNYRGVLKYDVQE